MGESAGRLNSMLYGANGGLNRSRLSARESLEVIKYGKSLPNWDKTEQTLKTALPLVGWSNDIRLLSEDKARLYSICRKVLYRNKYEQLVPKQIDEYALEVYDIIKNQLLDPLERADMASTMYSHSKRIKQLLPYIDEATISFFRGYDRAAMSLLFIALESYLRQLARWDPSKEKRIAFRRLTEAVGKLPVSDHALEAQAIVNAVYAEYDSLNPSRFYFNRHGLLHGLHGSTQYDQMNAGRLFLLFDKLCRAEGVRRRAWGNSLTMINYRLSIYRKCTENAEEMIMLSLKY